MKRKTLFFLLGLLFLVPLSLRAYDFKSGDLYYNITSDVEPYTVEVTYQKSRSTANYSGLTAAIIPSTVLDNGITYSVTNIGKGAFEKCSTLASVSIPEGVTSIGSSAFSGCDGLASITIPESVKSIGVSSFYNCKSLTSVTIPNGVTSIGNSAFSGCTNLGSITIGNSVTSIGSDAFKNCSKLTTVEWNAKNGGGWTSVTTSPFNKIAAQITSFTFGNTVDSIPMALCCNMSNVASIIIPNSVKKIGNSAFSSCSGLTSVAIPESVTSIGNSAFSSCSGLTSISIGNNVATIGNSAFSGCSGLTSVAIPNGVTSIGSSAFSGCSSLTSITIPESVTSIGASAFYSCSQLTTVVWNAKNCEGWTSEYDVPFYNVRSHITSFTFGDEVETIPSYLCYYMYNIPSVTLPNSVTSIGNSAFYKCSSLTELTLSNNLKKIGEYAFYECDNIHSITIPQNVLTIGAGAFTNCAFTQTTYTGDIADWCNIQFDGSGANPISCSRNLYIDGELVTNLVIPNGVTSIGNYAFYNCSNLTSIIIPESVTDIGEYAFGNCSPVQILAVPKTVTEIGADAFLYIPSVIYAGAATGSPWGAQSVVDGSMLGWFYFEDEEQTILKQCNIAAQGDIIIPETVTTIKDGAFRNCTGITSITIPESVTTIGSSVFYGCTGLTSVVWNAKNCRCSDSNSSPFWAIDSQITSFIFGNEVDTIPAYLCQNMSNLTTITIPESVTSMGWGIFSNCKAIASIVWNAKNCADFVVPRFHNDYNSLFDSKYVSHVKSFTFGDKVERIPNLVCSGMSGLTSITIPENVTSIGDRAFYDCTGLTSITWNARNCTNIGVYALPTKVLTLFGDSVQHIPTGVFLSDQPLPLFASIPYDAVSPAGPKSASAIYDIDKDGAMDFITSDSRYIKYIPDGNKRIYRSFGTVYSSEGILLQDTLTPIDNENTYSNFQFVNTNNDTDIDVVATYEGGYYEKIIKQCYLSRLASEVSAPLYVPQSFLVDADNNGMPDIYSYEDGHYIYYRQPDGSYLKTELQFLTDTTAIDSALYEKWKTTSNILLVETSIPSLANGMFVKLPAKRNISADEPTTSNLPVLRMVAATNSYNFRTIDTAIDLDRDGYIDLMSSTTGAVLYNLGNNTYIGGQFDGRVIVKDLNNDGITDYVIINESTKTVSLQIYTGAGSTRTQTLMQNLNISDVWCNDFDQDGDVDILLAFNYTTSSAYAYLVFFRNDGNNTFKKVENAFEQHFAFLGCKDVDNDGKYEIIARDSLSGRYNDCVNGDYWLIRYNNRFKTATDAAPFLSKTVLSGTAQPSFVVGDFNNDGVTEYWAECKTNGNRDDSYYIHGHFDAATPNTPPAKMSAPILLPDAEQGMLNIVWQQGNDAESSPLDITYALRIGTAPGKSDVWYAYANAIGQHLNVGEGNMGYALSRYVNVAGWQEGKYYIAVQAIDPAGLGGEWSDEVVYSHTMLRATFTIQTPTTTTADTVIVTYNGAPTIGYNYMWDFGDSVQVIAQEGQTYHIVYNTPGTKTISLVVADAAGKTSPMEIQTLEVAPVKFYATTGSTALSYADLDMDGVTDGIGIIDKISGFYQNNGDGTFHKLPKTFNSDMQISGTPAAPLFIDFNMDGLLDAVPYTNKGNLFINEEDFDFDYSTQDFNITFSGYYPTDVNSDGFPDWGGLDYGWDPYAWIDSGDRLTFTRQWGQTIDVNADGLMDKISKSSSTDVSIGLNRGNYYDTYPVPLPEEAKSIAGIADINSDGFIDFLLIKNDYCLVALLGDTSMTYSQTAELYLPKGYTVDRLVTRYGDLRDWRDYDNNGYPDLLLQGEIEEQSGYYILYLYPQYQVRCQPISYSSTAPSAYPFIDLDGDGVPDEGGFRMKTRITNTAPQQPTNIYTTQDWNGLTIHWDAADDRETPAAQMRYNVSVKRKGAEGDNAFVISPMNGLSNKAAVIPDYPYRRGTSMTIPLGRFSVGQEYEVQIQAIDLWNAHSDFTQPYTFKFEEEIATFMPDETCVNTEVSAWYAGTRTGNIVWQSSDDALVIPSYNGYECTLSWTEPGLKTVDVAVDGTVVSSTNIYVRAATDLVFSMPDEVLAGGDVTVVLPKVFADLTRSAVLRASEGVTIKHSHGDTTATLCFANEGMAWVETYVEGLCRQNAYRMNINVQGTVPVPEISLVSVDAATGSNLIRWQIPSLPEYINKIYVYKESGRTDNFVQLAELDPNVGEYIDMTSDPSIRATRYRLSYGSSFGIDGTPSDVHSSVHLMCNKGIGNNVNLYWTPYEGKTISSYTILRGTTPDDLAILEQLPGTNNTFVDRNAPENAWYAIAYDTQESSGIVARRLPAATMAGAGLSNMITSSVALTATLAESITIVSRGNVYTLTPQRKALNLYTEILPIQTTYKRVVWSIVQGDDLASITPDGVLSVKPYGMNGNVIVRAEATDGSGIYAEKEFVVKDFTPSVQQILLSTATGEFNMTKNNPELTVCATILPEDAPQQVEWRITYEDNKNILERQSELDGNCLLLVAASEQEGRLTLTASATDGSGVEASVVISVQTGILTGINQLAGTTPIVYTKQRELYVRTVPLYADYTIHSVDGKVVYTGSADHVTLPATGVYTIRFADGYVQKIVVQ
ncbi:MAG: leucine-rich repeat protein [Paludibacteraceae bacterium]